MSLMSIVNGLKSDDQRENLVACREARKTTSLAESSVDRLVFLGAIEYLVQLLSSPNAEIQCEAACTITNIVGGTNKHTKAVVGHNGIPPLINLLSSPHVNVCKQALWALSNIARDGPEPRDLIINYEIVEKLLLLLNPDTCNSFVEIATWTMSNLCYHREPPPNFDKIRLLLPYLAKFLKHEVPQIVENSCLALYYITLGTDDQNQQVVDTGVVPCLVELLNSGVTTALPAIGNIVSCISQQTEKILEMGILVTIRGLLSHNDRGNRKYATWFISHIAAGNVQHIQDLINADIIKPLIQVLANDIYKCQKEVVYAISNYTNGGTDQQIMLLVINNVIPALFNLTVAAESNILLLLLKAIKNILAAASRIGEKKRVCLCMEECDGLEILKNLMEYQNEDVSKLASEVIQFYTEVIVRDQ